MKCPGYISTFEPCITCIWYLRTFIYFRTKMPRLSILTSKALVTRGASAKVFKLTFETTIVINANFTFETWITLTFIDIATFVRFRRRFFTDIMTVVPSSTCDIETGINFYTVISADSINAIF